MEARAETAADLFRASFGTAPAVVASAPGRVNLLGEHTDYNGGAVLPIAIDARTFVAVGRTVRARCRAVSATEAPGEFEPAADRRSGAWWDYLAGVARELAAEGADPGSFDAAVVGDVPAGAGLASSAALEVAAATALLALAGAVREPSAVARLAHRAETAFVGVACGIMDQYAAALAREAHALHLQCDTGWFEHVPFADAVLVFDTGVRRDLRDSAFNTRRAECERALALLRRVDPALPGLAAASEDLIRAADVPDPLARRALHVVREHRRVGEAVAALRAGGSIPATLLHASHESLRVLYDCSIPELDWFVESAAGHTGVRGARLTGAGWGGCAIALGAEDALRAAAPALAHDYARAFGRGGRGWVLRARGAARVEATT
jgi:galactokinase